MNEQDATFMQLLALADLTLLASKLFVSPTTLAPEAFDIEPETRSSLEELLNPLNEGQFLKSLLETFDSIRETPREAWRYEWNRLFEGTVICPINETAYVRRDKGIIVADICGFYNAFGFESNETSGEKADHLSCEMEYVALMLVMIANTSRDGDVDASEITTKALCDFLDEHLGEWIRYFANRLNQCSPLAMYGFAVEVLRQFWNALASQFNLSTFEQLDDAEVDVDYEPEDSPYECDMTAEPTEFVPITGPAGSGMPEA